MSIRNVMVMIVLVGVGCGQKKEDNSNSSSVDVSSKRFLTNADFDLTRITETTAPEDLADELTGIPDLYNDTGSSGEGESAKETEKCSTTVPTLKVEGSKGKVTIYGEETLVDCKITETDADTGIVTTNTVNLAQNLYIVGACDSIDYSAVNGKTIEEYNKYVEEHESDFKCSSDEEHFFVNSKFKYTYQYESSADASKKITYEISGVSIMANANSEACKATKVDGGYKMSDCSDITLIDYKGTDGSVKVGGDKIAYKDTVSGDKPTDYWYGGGSIELTHNNWKGNVTYTAPDKAGSYSLSNGTTTKSGTLGVYGLTGNVMRLFERHTAKTRTTKAVSWLRR